MVEHSVFIGVVSHEGSRFSTSQGENGLGAQLKEALLSHGFHAHMVVEKRNLWQGAPESITSRDVQASLTEQARLEDSWDTYLAADSDLSGRQHVARNLRRAKRVYRRMFEPDPQFMIRLLNIELAHRALMELGMASGAEWVIVLEDDAASQDVSDLAHGLSSLTRDAPPNVEFINLSRSFSIEVLGVAKLLRSSGLHWSGSADRRILCADRPITNTVCAIAYGASFVSTLLAHFSQLPLFPVVPIDWKLNQVLMDMFHDGSLGRGSCLWIEPGPIEQLSMRAP